MSVVFYYDQISILKKPCCFVKINFLHPFVTQWKVRERGGLIFYLVDQFQRFCKIGN